MTTQKRPSRKRPFTYKFKQRTEEGKPVSFGAGGAIPRFKMRIGQKTLIINAEDFEKLKEWHATDSIEQAIELFHKVGNAYANLRV